MGVSRVQMAVALKNMWLCEFNENCAYATLATPPPPPPPGSFHRVCVHALRNSVMALEEEVLEGQQDHISANAHSVYNYNATALRALISIAMPKTAAHNACHFCHTCQGQHRFFFEKRKRLVQ